MQEIMISIQPEWVEKILKGEKTVEIRKSFPKCELPCKVFVYCTKGKSSLVWITRKGEELPYSDGKICEKDDFLTVPKCSVEMWDKRGKVVAEFILNKVSTYDYDIDFENDKQKMYYIRSGELDKTCLTYDELLSYGQEKPLYGWNIDNLKIYNKPKELSQFKKQNRCYTPMTYEELGCREGCCVIYDFGECDGRCSKLERPPQSWFFVEEETE